MKKKLLTAVVTGAVCITLLGASPVWAEETVNPENAVTIIEEAATEETATQETTTQEAATQETTTQETTTQETTTQETASEEPATEESPITPDSEFLYSLKTFFEEVRLFFTFDDETRAVLLMELANERLTEAELMAAKGNIELVEELLKEYEEKILEAQENLNTEEASESAATVSKDTYNSLEEDSQESVSGEVYNYKAKNIEALTKVLEKLKGKLPENSAAIAAIQKNLDKAIAKQEAHVEKKKDKEESKKQKQAEKEQKQIEKEQKQAEKEQRQIEKEQKQAAKKQEQKVKAAKKAEEEASKAMKKAPQQEVKSDNNVEETVPVEQESLLNDSKAPEEESTQKADEVSVEPEEKKAEQKEKDDSNNPKGKENKSVKEDKGNKNK